MVTIEVLDGLTPNCLRVRQTQAVDELAVLRVLAKESRSSSSRSSENRFAAFDIGFPIPNVFRQGVFARYLTNTDTTIATDFLALSILLEIELRHDSPGTWIRFKLMESTLYIGDSTHRIVSQCGSDIPYIRICPHYLGYESCFDRATAKLSLNLNRQITPSNPGPYKKEASSKNMLNSEPIVEDSPSLSQSGSRFIEYHPHLPVKKCVRRRIWGNAIDFDL
jgi:hypothetical protein